MTTIKKQKKYFFKKIALTIFFSILFSFFPTKENRACAWMAMAAAVYETTTTEVNRAIEGLKMGVLKQQAISMLDEQMNIFISGASGGGARFIINWENYLVKDPVYRTQNYMNDYISRATSGRGSISGYRVNGSFVLGAETEKGNEGFGKEAVLGVSTQIGYTPSYAQQMTTMVQEEVIHPKEFKLYNSEPEDMFKYNNLAGLNSYFEIPPPVVKSYAVAEYQARLEEEQRIATAKALAYQGFIGNETPEGLISYPGSLLKEAKANIDRLPSLEVISATNLTELATATTSKLISGITNMAISGVKNSVTNVTINAANQVNQSIQSRGPGALYGR